MCTVCYLEVSMFNRRITWNVILHFIKHKLHVCGWVCLTVTAQTLQDYRDKAVEVATSL
jgi:hypothetical protein